MDEDGTGADESSFSTNLLCMAYGGGRLGAALYDPATMEVQLMADILDPAPNFVQMNAVINQTHPDQVITSCKQDERLLIQLKTLFDAEETVNSMQSPLHLLPSIDFRADTCRHRVMSIVLPNDTSTNEEDHANFIRSTIDFSQTSMIRALGGLLKFLDRNPQQTSIGCQHIMIVKKLIPEDHVYISQKSLQSLQVFSNVMHPSSYKAETFREGLSLFGILNKCVSTIGANSLRRLLLQPLKDTRKLEERLNLVEFFTQHENQEVRCALQMNLRRIKNLTPLLKRMNNWHPLSSDWERLISSLTVAASIVQIFSDIPTQQSMLNAESSPSKEIYDLIKTLQETINLTETKELRRFTVQLGLDPQLDRWKQLYNDMSTLLESNLQLCQPELPEQVDVCSMNFFPMIGFLVLVESWSQELTIDEKLNLPGLDFQFSDDDRYFYKTAHCRKLDQEVGDLSLAISDTESSVQHRLIRIVLDSAECIQRITSFCGEVDAIIALAQSAVEYNYKRPTFMENDSIEIVDGRHPILELCSSTVVPNNFKSGMESSSDRIKIITGANGSGKSVFLKQVILIVYMAQCGSFVPARVCRMGSQQAILTVMPASVTHTGEQSGFMYELQQLSAALCLLEQQQELRADENQKGKLLIMDEFGGGTLADDGTALLVACLQHLIDKRHHCPHTIVSTHAPQVLRLLVPSQMVTPLSPQMVVDQQQGQLTFLYRMTTGVAAHGSQAIEAARMVDMPDQLLKRAQQVLDSFSEGKLPEANDKLKDIMSNIMSRRCAIVEMFMRCQLQTEDIANFLQQIIAAGNFIESPTIPGSVQPSTH